MLRNPFTEELNGGESSTTKAAVTDKRDNHCRAGSADIAVGYWFVILVPSSTMVFYQLSLHLVLKVVAASPPPKNRQQ